MGAVGWSFVFAGVLIFGSGCVLVFVSAFAFVASTVAFAFVFVFGATLVVAGVGFAACVFGAAFAAGRFNFGNERLRLICSHSLTFS